jgi:deoxyribodipyrimidine photo-lyase
MRRDFQSRPDFEEYLKIQFPWADGELSEVLGGRAAAEEKLDRFQDTSYAASRNFLSGTVSRLSPYIHHGVVTLREVRERFAGRNAGRDSLKFVQELAWRDYWQRVYASVGDAIWRDMEIAKTGLTYRVGLPIDLGRTGLACMDGFAQELETTGYLHNHARMWLASYLIHWRGIAWQSGATWFLQHLLDGDPASNNLSWQWVASTFSSKPYYFNRENLERYSESSYCRACPRNIDCPFEGSYEQLAEQLFPQFVPA